MPERRSDPQRTPPDPLEQGLDRLVSAGRQLVDGVSGARPGSRGGPRSPRPVTPAGSGRPRLGELGRWVEDKLDWILEDEDDWREPWQEPRPRRLDQPRGMTPAERVLPAEPPDTPGRPAPAAAAGRRRPLEAISRRGERRRPAVDADPIPRESLQPTAGAPSPVQTEAEAWPDDTSFARPRWQRPLRESGRAPDLSADAAARAAAARQRESARPLPRSSRRRSG
ncbi:MAG: RNA helicase [Synechococcaceae cyanobacterium]